MFGFSGSKALALASLLMLVFATSASAAQPPVGLGSAFSFALLGGSTITNTGNSVINGDLGLHPGTAVTGFPPGTVHGAVHKTDAVALNAKSDLTIAYKDAAGRSLSSTSAPDIGGKTLKPGVYRTGSVPSMGLTGNLTLDAQGDPSAVFIFQVESTLVTATDSSVSLLNGAQACNVYWQVGSSATLGTRTAFKGNILALTSISVNNGVVVQGRLLARNGAVTLINDTVNRSQCAPGTGGDDGTSGPGSGPGTGSASGPGPDTTGPGVRLIGPPGFLRPPASGSGPPRATVCASRNFTAKVRLRDRAGIKSVKVYIDGKRIKSTRLTRFSLKIRVRGLRVGAHRITVVARDRAGNRSVTKRRFARCALVVAAPRFAPRFTG
jgi:hypothetical protein